MSRRGTTTCNEQCQHTLWPVSSVLSTVTMGVIEASSRCLFASELASWMRSRIRKVVTVRRGYSLRFRSSRYRLTNNHARYISGPAPGQLVAANLVCGSIVSIHALRPLSIVRQFSSPCRRGFLSLFACFSLQWQIRTARTAICSRRSSTGHR